MKIGIISPGRQYGATSFSILFSKMISETMGVKTTLVSLNPDDVTMRYYLNLPKETDIMTNLKQVCSLLANNSMSAEDLDDYTIKRGKNFRIINSSSDRLTEHESAELLDFVLKIVKHNAFVIDANCDIDNPVLVPIIEECDYFVTVVDQSDYAIDKFLAWKKTEEFKKMEDKGMMYVISKFNPIIGPHRDISKKLKIRHRKCGKLAYNPFIAKMANRGELSDIVDYALDKDERVLNVYYDLLECVNILKSNLGYLTKGAVLYE